MWQYDGVGRVWTGSKIDKFVKSSEIASICPLAVDILWNFWYCDGVRKVVPIFGKQAIPDGLMCSAMYPSPSACRRLVVLSPPYTTGHFPGGVLKVHQTLILSIRLLPLHEMLTTPILPLQQTFPTAIKSQPRIFRRVPLGLCPTTRRFLSISRLILRPSTSLLRTKSEEAPMATTALYAIRRHRFPFNS